MQSVWKSWTHSCDVWSSSEEGRVSVIPFLREYARRLTSALKAINDHLVDMVCEFQKQMPEANKEWLAAQICDAAIDGVFQT